jgi:hypothetical protein
MQNEKLKAIVVNTPSVTNLLGSSDLWATWIWRFQAFEIVEGTGQVGLTIRQGTSGYIAPLAWAFRCQSVERRCTQPRANLPPALSHLPLTQAFRPASRCPAPTLKHPVNSRTHSESK